MKNTSESMLNNSYNERNADLYECIKLVLEGTLTAVAFIFQFILKSD